MVLDMVANLARPSSALLHTMFGCTLLLGIRLKAPTLQTILQNELFRENEMLLRACIVPPVWLRQAPRMTNTLEKLHLFPFTWSSLDLTNVSLEQY